VTDVLPSSSTFTERPGAEPEVFARELAEPDDGLPPIEDPFLRPEGRALLARALGRPRLSRRALGSLLSALLLAPIGAVAALGSFASALLLAPIGALAAIGLGWSARRAIDAPGALLRGRGLATAGIIVGVLVLPSWLVATRAYLGAQPGELGPSALAAPLILPPRPSAAPVPRPAPAPRAPVDPGDFVVPQVTRASQRGAVTLVDVGVSTSSLATELATQRAAAATAGETMLVMTVRARCEPCNSVEASLSDARMQAALDKVRLVRVDIGVFHDDLEGLRIPHDGIPGFFLLSPDLRPRDGIDGGEWDDDIPANMAPVLSAFVRGKYKARRSEWEEQPGSGMRL
jgi:hypothetical protein